jgi:Zn-dependent protease
LAPETRSTYFSFQYPWTGPPKQPRFWFSRTEVKHVIIGLTLVSAVGLSLQRSLRIIGIYNFGLLLFAVGLFTLGFILHELAHKFSAQSYGLWAEFRLSTLGVLITTISVFSPIKFIAPGMVVIAGIAGQEVIGQVALAGPLTNLAIAFLAMLPSFALPVGALHHVLALGCWVNSYMALFNLIPFGDFDGLKVFKWSKTMWVLIVALAIALLFYSSQFVFLEA